MLNRQTGIIRISFCLLFLLLNNAYAQINNADLPKREGVKIGNLLVHTAFKTGVDFDPNIYLTNGSEKYDVITLVHPSIGCYLPLGDNSVSLEYGIAFNFFQRFSENNHTDHFGKLLAEINLTDYKITLSNDFSRFTDRAGSEDVARLKRYRNDFRAGVSAQFEKLGFDLSYRNKFEEYLTNSIIFNPMTYKDKNSLTHIGDLEATYRVLPKTYLLWENTLGYIDYYKSSYSPNSFSIESLLGVKGDWFNKVVMNLRGGAKFQQYDSSTLVDDDSYCNFVMRGGADYSLTPDDIFALALERENYESTYLDMNYYEVNKIGLNYKHMFNKVIANAFGSFELNLYPNDVTVGDETAKRRDKLYSAGCSFRYDVQKFLSLEARYEFKKRDSKFSSLDYTDNLTTLRGTVGF